MTIDLLKIQHEDVHIVMRGTYEPSKNRSSSSSVSMHFSYSSPNAKIEVYDGA